MHPTPTRTRVARNTILVFGTRILTLAVSLSLTLAIAWRLGSKGLGGYGLILAYSFVLQQVAAVGLGALLPREVARRPDEASTLLKAALLIALPAGALFGASLWPLSGLLGYETELRNALLLAGISLVPGAVSVIAEAFLVAREEGEAIAILSVLENLLRCALGLAVVFLGGGLLPLASIFLLSRCLGALASVVVLRRIMPAQPSGGVLRAAVELARALPVFAGLFILTSILFRADVVLLSVLKDTAEVGIYNAAYRLYEVAVLAPTTAAAMVYPVLARLRTEAPGREASLASSSVTALLVALTPFVLGMSLAAAGIVRLLYPAEEFRRTAIVLMILPWSLLARVIDVLLGHAMLAAGRQRADLGILAAGVVTSVGMNLVLIPLAGAEGAAIATVVTGTLLAVLHLRYVNRHLYRVRFGPRFARALPAAALTAGFLIALRHSGVWWTVPCSFLVFAVVARAIGAVKPGFFRAALAREGIEHP